MKIINIIKAILLLSVVITLPSCLDLDPKAQLADANLCRLRMIINYMPINFMNGRVILLLLFSMGRIVTRVRT